MGLTLTVTCCVEVPIFAINGWILRTLGVHRVLHLTIAVCLIRTVSSLPDVALPCAQLPCCWPEPACRQSGGSTRQACRAVNKNLKSVERQVSGGLDMLPASSPRCAQAHCCNWEAAVPSA